MAGLYSNLKFLQHGEHLESLRSGQLLAPVHIRIKPINRCNHACWYCAYRSDSLQLGNRMDLQDRIPEDKMAEIIDDIIAMQVKAVTFSGGGEPMLYKGLPAIVERLGRAKVKVASLTNGSNLQGDMADSFAEWGAWVRVSLDGWDDASYAAARSIAPGSFTRLIANMRAFARRNSACVLGVSFIIGRDNHAHIVEICRLLKQVGVNHVKLAGAVVANDAAANNLYHQDFRAAVSAQIAEAQGMNDAHFTVVDHYHALDERFQKGYHSCPFLHYLTVIGADCAVYSCQDKAYTDVGRLGSIRDRSFREFWFSAENRLTLAQLDPSQA